MEYTGRTKILSSVSEITPENVVQVLQNTLPVHLANSAQIDYLYNYRKGKQPILDRIKEVRPEICNKIVENRADEIVAFKTGYLCGEPLQYVSRGSTDATSTDIGKLNDMMLMCGKSNSDMELAEWRNICGTAYRMASPNSIYIEDKIVPSLKKGVAPELDESPFDIYTLDPRYTYVVYNSGFKGYPLMSVTYTYKNESILQEEFPVVYSIYTDNYYFEIEAGMIVSNNRIKTTKPLAVKLNPIIEYPLNHARVGSFETVLSILDAINNVQSNRVDGVEQFIQSLILLYNCDIDEDGAKNLRSAGLVKLKSTDSFKADLKILSDALDQQQTQTLVDYMYQTVLNIVGMPNRNGGSSTSDTGAAVQLRDGWQGAEARAKLDELSFRESERKFLKVILKIVRDTVGTSLTLSDIETKFTRRIYENAQSKAQTLIAMLNCPKIAPILAFTHCGLFSDPEDAAKQSAEYEKMVKEEQEEYQNKLAETAKKADEKENNNEGIQV